MRDAAFRVELATAVTVKHPIADADDFDAVGARESRNQSFGVLFAFGLDGNFTGRQTFCHMQRRNFPDECALLRNHSGHTRKLAGTMTGTNTEDGINSVMSHGSP